MRYETVESVDHRRVHRAARLVARPEHEVVDQQLGATVEELRQGALPFVRVEAVLLLDRQPGKLTSLAGELVAAASVLLLLGEQLVAYRLPLLGRHDRVLPCCEMISHWLSSSSSNSPPGSAASTHRRSRERQMDSPTRISLSRPEAG
jgi:hypothetical protein